MANFAAQEQTPKDMEQILQDKVWSTLPKEFKEEVKEIYLNAVEHHPCGYNHKTDLMKYLFGRHNLTSDAVGEEILTCEKSKAMQLYSHLLDLVENERMSEHYSEWCDLEREYIALFGENVFADYFGSKCLPDEEPKPAEHFGIIVKSDFRNERMLHIAAQIVASMIGSDDWTTWRGGSNKEIWHNMAKSSLEIADALIAECEKGGDNAAE